MDSAETDRPLQWKAPTIVAGLTLASVVLLVMWSPDFGPIAGQLLVAPLGGLLLFVLTFTVRGKSIWLRIAIFFAYIPIAWLMVHHSYSIRTELRWVMRSRYWKAQTLAQPNLEGGNLKCVMWDAWGWAGMDTDVYVMFSPDDRLREYSGSNLAGLPQPVASVSRLEDHWYSVTLFTSDEWNECAVTPP